MKFSILAAGLAAALCICAMPASASSGGLDLQGLLTATQHDLAAAKADADAHGDQIASQCYAGVSSYVTANPVSLPSVGSVAGVASAFQVARDAVKGAQGAAATGLLPTPIIQSCGALALDVQNDLGKIAASGVSIFGLKLF